VATARGFNPRPPHGRRHDSNGIAQSITLFQSTPPSREATKREVRETVDLSVSIHAPITGGDANPRDNLAMQATFQSTPPSREATRSAAPAASRTPFQSTPPSREATYKTVLRMARMIVSIHAPLTGGDIALPAPDRVDEVSIHAPLTGGDGSAHG